jgi:hypothetical protein
VTPAAFALAYPSVPLQGASVNQPYQLADNISELSLPPVNPNVKEPVAGYAIEVCNTSQVALHTVDSVVVTLERFSP